MSYSEVKPRLGLRPRPNARQTVVAVLFVGLVLRLLCLGCKSLWLDEALSVRVAQAGLPALIAGTYERYHPPLYFLVLGEFMRLGTAEAVLRLPAAIAGSIGVALVYALSCVIFGRATAISATAFAAVSPLLVWYSQEARDYSLLVMWALLALFLLVQAARTRGVHWWLLFVVATAAGLYTHYMIALLLPVQVLLLSGLYASGRSGRLAFLWLLCGWLAALGLFMPWLRTPAASAFVKQLTSPHLYLSALTAGRSELLSVLDGKFFLPVLYLGVAALFALGAWVCYRIVRSGKAWLLALRDSRVAQRGALGVFVLLLIVSVVPRGYVLKRYTHVLWFIVPMAFGWLWPWRAKAKAFLGVALGLSLVASMVNVLVIPKEQWRPVVDTILSQQSAGDVVLLEPSYTNLPFNYYSDGLIETAGVSGGGDVVAKMAELAAGHERIWFVHHLRDANPSHVAGITQWLGDNTTQLASRQFYLIQVDLYAR